MLLFYSYLFHNFQGILNSKLVPSRPEPPSTKLLFKSNLNRPQYTFQLIYKSKRQNRNRKPSPFISNRWLNFHFTSAADASEEKESCRMAPPHPAPGTQSWILVITELHRYQGVGYKSDIVVISGSGPVTLRGYFKIFRVVVQVVSCGIFFFHLQETNLSLELYFINTEIEIEYERKLINNAIMIFLHGMPLH